MLGILTEKVSAARNFATALGGISGQFNGENYVIVAASGHMFEFITVGDMVAPELKERYKDWDNVDVNLPWNHREMNWAKQLVPGKEAAIQAMRKTLYDCDEIAIATDVDPTGEGDLLGFEILEALNFTNKRISRFYFVDESAKEIRKAFTTRKLIADYRSYPDYVKALYRSKFDFLTMQFTRVARVCSDGVSTLRQGRLKSAMVAIVGDGLKAVAEYKKIPFYQNRFSDENGNIYTNKFEPEYPDMAQVPQKYAESPVVKESVEPKTMAPKKLIDLATLASMLASKHKPKLVLDTYQKMYEDQVVSYPRTEDKTITPEQFNELLPLADKIAAVVQVDVNLLTHRIPRKTHVKASGAHGANRPGPNVPASLDSLTVKYGEAAKDIYELVAKSYLAMLAPDYEYELERGYVLDYPDFKTVSHIPGFAGWKAVFGVQDDDDAEGQRIGTIGTPFVFEGFPQKSKTPTMKWLMAQLEKNDVGTGATRTSTYAEVTKERCEKSNKYPLLVDTKGKITMTVFGEMSYVLLPGTKIGSVELTEELQQDMRDIAEGKADPESLLGKVADYVVHDLAVMRANGSGIPKKQLKPKYTGVWATTGQEVRFSREWSGYKFSDDECERLLRGEEIRLENVVSPKSGKTYSCDGKLAEQLTKDGSRKFIGFKPDFTKLPEVFNGHRFTAHEIAALQAGQIITCNDLVAKESGNFYTADLKWDAEKGITMMFNIPLQFNGHTFTAAELLALENGKVIKCETLVSKKGGYYGANLKWNTTKNRIDMTFDFPESWSKHVFTDTEIETLKAGKTVVASDFVGKKGFFSAEIKWDKKLSKIVVVRF